MDGTSFCGEDMSLSRLCSFLTYSVAAWSLALSGAMLHAEETAPSDSANVLIADGKISATSSKTVNKADTNSNIKPHDESDSYGAADGTPPEPHRAKKDS